MFITKEQFITQTRTWLGTSFKHQGRIKKNRLNRGGVDCLGLLMGVAKELNLGSGLYDSRTNKEIPFYKFDDKDYNSLSSPKKLIEGFNRLCDKVDNLNNSKVADILLINFQGMPKHIALISNINRITDNGNNIKIYYDIIHSYIAYHKMIDTYYLLLRRDILK